MIDRIILMRDNEYLTRKTEQLTANNMDLVSELEETRNRLRIAEEENRALNRRLSLLVAKNAALVAKSKDTIS